MKLPLTPKSFHKSSSGKPLDSPEQQVKQTDHDSSFITQTLLRPASQNDTRFKAYFKLFPQNKRKQNISLFNFFINKQAKKSHINQKLDQSEQKDTKRYMQQQNIIIKRVKAPLSSLSTEKLCLLPTSQRQKFQKFIQKTNMNREDASLQKNCTDRNFNKINESLVKNTKFDRKKYMYYRYRKKNSPQKNNVSFNQFPEKDDFQRAKPSKAGFKPMVIRADDENKIINQNEGNQGVQYKYSFFGVLPPKNKSFSEVKCKLTIQPIPRQPSYKIVDRKNVSRTSRQTRDKKQPSQNQNKIFTQAIHFKSRKTHLKSKQAKQNPQINQSQRKQDQILGWNLNQQSHLQDYLF